MSEPRRATSVFPARSWPASHEVGAVTLCWDDRHRRRIRLSMDGDGGEFLLDLPQAARLAEGDGLALASGGIVRVVAAPEPLLEVRAGASSLAQLAYHLGNRHLPVQILGDVILIRQDHVIEAMLIGLGAECRTALRPFSPEQGAYGGGHSHDHHHHDDDAHAHGAHGGRHDHSHG
ncbi:urease accessory protein UreE [Methylocella tundrae]|nr:urease accessory protein UreE [Methylocella tundrae]